VLVRRGQYEAASCWNLLKGRPRSLSASNVIFVSEAVFSKQTSTGHAAFNPSPARPRNRTRRSTRWRSIILDDFPTIKGPDDIAPALSAIAAAVADGELSIEEASLAADVLQNSSTCWRGHICSGQVYCRRNESSGQQSARGGLFINDRKIGNDTVTFQIKRRSLSA
jgi:hypothetical protein